jgi:hypothetical protein
MACGAGWKPPKQSTISLTNQPHPFEIPTLAALEGGGAGNGACLSWSTAPARSLDISGESDWIA